MKRNMNVCTLALLAMVFFANSMTGAAVSIKKTVSRAQHIQNLFNAVKNHTTAAMHTALDALKRQGVSIAELTYKNKNLFEAIVESKNSIALQHCLLDFETLKEGIRAAPHGLFDVFLRPEDRSQNYLPLCQIFVGDTINAQDEDGDTLLSIVVKRLPNDMPPALKKELLARREDSDAPLSMHGILWYLIKSGADINQKNKRGQSALTQARKKKLIEVVSFLDLCTQKKHHKEQIPVLVTPEVKPLRNAANKESEELKQSVELKYALSHGSSSAPLRDSSPLKGSPVKEVSQDSVFVGIRTSSSSSSDEHVSAQSLSSPSEFSPTSTFSSPVSFSSDSRNSLGASPLEQQVAPLSTASSPTFFSSGPSGSVRSPNVIQEALLSPADHELKQQAVAEAEHKNYSSELKIKQEKCYQDTCIAAMVKEGANIDILLDWVVQGNSAALKKACNVGISMDVVDKLGQTPLHVAIVLGDKAIVKLLLQHGARLDIPNNMGLTPLDVAAFTKNTPDERDIFRLCAKKHEQNKKLKLKQEELHRAKIEAEQEQEKLQQAKEKKLAAERIRKAEAAKKEQEKREAKIKADLLRKEIKKADKQKRLAETREEQERKQKADEQAQAKKLEEDAQRQREEKAQQEAAALKTLENQAVERAAQVLADQQRDIKNKQEEAERLADLARKQQAEEQERVALQAQQDAQREHEVSGKQEAAAITAEKAQRAAELVQKKEADELARAAKKAKEDAQRERDVKHKQEAALVYPKPAPVSAPILENREIKEFVHNVVRLAPTFGSWTQQDVSARSKKQGTARKALEQALQTAVTRKSVDFKSLSVEEKNKMLIATLRLLIAQSIMQGDDVELVRCHVMVLNFAARNLTSQQDKLNSFAWIAWATTTARTWGREKTLEFLQSLYTPRYDQAYAAYDTNLLQSFAASAETLVPMIVDQEDANLQKIHEHLKSDYEKISTDFQSRYNRSLTPKEEASLKKQFITLLTKKAFEKPDSDIARYVGIHSADAEMMLSAEEEALSSTQMAELAAERDIVKALGNRNEELHRRLEEEYALACQYEPHGVPLTPSKHLEIGKKLTEHLIIKARNNNDFMLKRCCIELLGVDASVFTQPPVLSAPRPTRAVNRHAFGSVTAILPRASHSKR